MKLNYVADSGDSEEFHTALRKRNNLVKKKFGENSVIIAAPHHAPKGKTTIADGSRVADNNAGYVARNIANHCKAQLVVATRANKDPNKVDGTYHKHTVGKAPAVFVEIHGLKSGPERPNDVEISCGSPDYSVHAEKMAEKVKHYLFKIAEDIEEENPEMADSLRQLTVCGKYGEIVMTAEFSKSIIDAKNNGIMPYHIELGPDMRKSQEGTTRSIPKKGVFVAHAIAAALADIHEDVIFQKSNKLEDLLG